MTVWQFFTSLCAPMFCLLTRVQQVFGPKASMTRMHMAYARLALMVFDLLLAIVWFVACDCLTLRLDWLQTMVLWVGMCDRSCICTHESLQAHVSALSPHKLAGESVQGMRADMTYHNPDDLRVGTTAMLAPPYCS